MKRRAVVVQLVPFLLAGGVIAGGAGVLGACSSNTPGGGFTLDAGGGATSSSHAVTSSQATLGGGSSGMTLGGGDGGGSTPLDYDAGPCPWSVTDEGTVDHDGDGWTPVDGDCNDCNKYINPGAYDIPGNMIDEDCNGTPDDAVTDCDSSLTQSAGPAPASEATTNGAEGAMAMDLCKTTTSDAPLPMKTWGVISAAYVLPDNSNSPDIQTGDDIGPCTYSEESFQLGFGILGPTFGMSNQTQHGVKMLGLSSGTARQPGDNGYSDVWGFDKCYTSGAPRGFPGETPACGNVAFGKPHDGAALQVVLRVPTNALTMSFDTNFFSYEFPDYVCSTFNDTFVAIMLPSPQGEPTTANDNIAFDSKGNIISINAGFLQVCDPTTQAGADGTGPMRGFYSYPCPEGPAKLLGTGFGIDSPQAPKMYGIPLENHASTDWLTTTVSVAKLAGQQITLLFAVWDSSDGILDTTVLLDNVQWTFATAPNQVPPPDAGSPITQPK